MSTKLYVGNLGFGTVEAQVRDAFSEYGQVTSVSLITDRVTGQSRGFAFVEYSSADSAQRAIDSMNGAVLDGRTLNVSVARERGEGGGSGQSRERRW
jgi:RNA recognition motif-containing protein